MTSCSVADETDDWCVGLACVLKLVFITSLRPITTTLWASCAVPATRSAWCPGVWTSSTTCCSRSVGPSTARRTCGSGWSPGFTAPTASRPLRPPRQALSDSKLNVEEISYHFTYYFQFLFTWPSFYEAAEGWANHLPSAAPLRMFMFYGPGSLPVVQPKTLNVRRNWRNFLMNLPVSLVPCACVSFRQLLHAAVEKLCASLSCESSKSCWSFVIWCDQGLCTSFRN